MTSSDDSGRARREPTGLEIAVIGMAGRFPGARDVDEYWDNLAAGRESFRELSDDELDAAGVPAEVYRREGYVRRVRDIEGSDLFDAGFFDVSPREAERIDPQHRVFLEQAWEALEDAGYDPDRTDRPVGVFAGVRMSGYALHFLDEMTGPSPMEVQLANEKDFFASRVSYKLDLGGPAVVVQTACSTGLVAVHMACQSLIAGECDMALAGGGSIRSLEQGYLVREGDVSSPDGRIRTFDADARGTVFGNGSAVVVLKRLEDALEDGDTVRAVILGTGVTNDGAHKVGFTAPSVEGQSRAIRAALEVAEVHPEDVSYVEAHGTGTPLGDPIEIEALTRAYRAYTDATGFCRIGSVKPNIGHLSTACGIAGLIKLIQALEHETLPPSINFETPNPNIDFASSPFRVNAEMTPWERNETPRRAGVSAFGLGGTNAHLILEEPPLPEAPEVSEAGEAAAPRLLLLSARSDDALTEQARRLADHLERAAGNRPVPLDDVAFTLREGRRRHRVRRVVVAADAAEAVEALRRPASRGITGRAGARPAEVAFLFPGQGAQHPHMAAGLYRDEEIFRREVDRCAEALREPLGFDLRDALFPEAGAEDEAAERLRDTRVTQPALFTVEWAAAALWRSRGVEPAALLGHSVGELVAATVAGVWTLEEGLKLIAERGRLMAALPAGSMLAVSLDEAETASHLGPELSVAALNAPGRTVVSGPSAAVDDLARRLAEAGIQARPLHTSHAFHSAMMEPILGPFAEAFRGMSLRPPEIPFVSNASGTWITAEEATDPAYWARQLRGAVRFTDGLATLTEEADDGADAPRALLEVGPGNTLITLARKHPRAKTATLAASLPHPKEARGGEGDRRALLEAAGRLWCAGADMDAAALGGAGETGRRVPLPTYPFERKRYWRAPTGWSPAQGGDGRVAATSPGGALGPVPKTERLDDWFHLPVWTPGTPPSEPERVEGRFLVIADPSGDLARAVAARVEQRGGAATVVPHETHHGADRAAWENVLESWRAAHPGDGPDTILHLASVDGSAETARSVDPREHVERGFWSLLGLGQALGRRALREDAPDVRLVVVSDGLQQAPGDGSVAPGKATLVGPARVLPKETPGLRVVSVDLPFEGVGGEGREAAAGRVVAEAARLGGAAAPEETAFVAHRRDPATGAVVRWRWGFEASPLEAPSEGATRLRDEGVYLVTGGLGGLGLTFARFLAETRRARLVLTSRSGLGTDESDRDRARAVRELEALGAQVLVVAADVADRDAMAAVVTAARERFGRIEGVLHTAGVPGGGLVQLKTREAAQAVLAPKVEGTLVLEDVLAADPPDWTVLCSSTLAVLGSAGQVDYCAANAFLDAFARDRTAAGRRTLSVAWGSWEEVGMAAAADLTGGSGSARPVEHPILTRRRDLPKGGHVLSAELSAETTWVLDEHRILGTPALPGTGHLELAVAAWREVTGTAASTLSDVVLLAPLAVPVGETRTLEVHLLPGDAPEGFRFEIRSRAPEATETTLHSRGRVGPADSERAAERHDVAALAARLEPAEVPDWDAFAHAGGDGESGGADGETGGKLVLWGEHWNSLQQAWSGEGEGLARLALPERYADEIGAFVLHPSLLDVASALASALHGESYLPLSYGRVRVAGPLPARFHSHLRQVGGKPGGDTLTVDLSLVDDDGREVVAVERFLMKRPAAGAAPATAGTAKTAPRRPEAKAGAASGTGGAGILPAEGAEALRRVLSRDFPFPWVAVSARDLDALRRREALGASRGASAAPPPAAEAPGERHERPELDSDYVAPRNDVEETLAAIWRHSLGLDRVGVHDNFFELGGDSVVGIGIISAAQERGLDLAPDQLFEHQTVAELAAALATVRHTAPEAVDGAPPTGDEGAAADLSDDEMAAVLAQLGDLP